ncbi:MULTISPECIES: hypothetical protein [unclassified Streptosporangium]|uniref:hypothetical protein n=1 Tax=unclassified Streptosporangium TaxID=2632669 RepID=UPI002E27FC77|nr:MULTISPECIES: hypothetical protein [unclassified Streptosporangium]
MPRSDEPEIAVSLPHLVRSRNGFLVEKENLDRALAEALAVLEGLGEFWGADEDGRKFAGNGEGKGYLAALEQVRKHVGSLGEIYSGTGNNLVLGGADIEAVDWSPLARAVTEIDKPHIEVPTTMAELE